VTIATAAATVYAVAVLGVIAFQLALAIGAPWGSYAMGGAFPGRFPRPMRIAAVVQAALLAVTIAVVVSRAGLMLATWSDAARWAIWGVVVIAAIGVVLNAASRSAGERRIWVPVTVVMLASALAVAVSPR
jgi:hypothetical protein